MWLLLQLCQGNIPTIPRKIPRCILCDDDLLTFLMTVSAAAVAAAASAVQAI